MLDSVVVFQGTIYEKGYGFIARQVMRDKNLKIQSKAIYAYISSFAANSNSGERTAFPSVELQCAELGITDETYFKYRKPLVEKGYLQIEKRRGNSAKFDRNLYIICAVPVPLETIPENIGYGKNVDTEPFEPHPNLPSTVEPSTVESGTKTTNSKTTSTKKNISLVSSSRESELPIYELLDKALKQDYPNVPFDDIRAELISDETAVINTIKQYHAMLEYRLKNYKPKKQAKQPQFKAKRSTYVEATPEWFDEESEPNTSVKQTNEISDEEKKAEIEEILKSMRNND